MRTHNSVIKPPSTAKHAQSVAKILSKVQEYSHTTNNVEIGDGESRHVGQGSFDSHYLSFCLE